MRRLTFAAVLLLVAGCDTNGVDPVCLVGPQRAFEDNDISVRLTAPAVGDTVRLGEPFPFAGRVEVNGPDLTRLSVRLVVTRVADREAPFDGETVLSEPLDIWLGVTEIDQTFTIGRLRGGITSADLGPDEQLRIGLDGEIRFPVESEGPGCGTTISGRGVGTNATVTVLPPRPTR